ncbi:Ig-like domain-containing protein [Anaeromicropila herbilytica]|uniref:Bacterial Ig domain-containing protein n=1 Tax=Anaeromicropila herbilytica TaxID=2785025 RepID=A0A7R7EKU2_9FIRM|nr:Ig-like domain-containing protein [Anaeromicropila herbilytica]BCN30731.1 hypothetical protein bsdtb5_20260 [Anaeromicropila herbilytica]
MKTQMKSFMKKLLVLTMILSLVSIPRVVAQAAGFLVFNDGQKISPDSITGSFAYLTSGKATDSNNPDFKVTATINGTSYDGTIISAGTRYNYNYSVSYPIQKNDTDVIITVTDGLGGKITQTYNLIANQPIQLSVDSLNYTSTTVTGTTEANAKVTATIEGKTYEATADSSGNYKIKIPAQKSDTTIVVKSINEKGYYSTKNVTVSNPNCLLSSSQDLLKSTTKVTGTVTGALKGDYITVKVGNKTYKTTLKEAKKQKYSVSVKNLKFGQYITVSLYNKHGQQREWYKSEVYYATKVKLGMTQNQVLHTAYYGKPDSVIKSIVAGKKCEQWGYHFGSKLVYLWFQNGVLTSIDQY